jgi:hypothetical protein
MASGAGEVLLLEPDREGPVRVLAEERPVVGDLIGRREALVDLHVALSEPDPRRAVALGELGRSAGVERRDPEAVLGDELLLAHAGQDLVGVHPATDGAVVRGHVLEALLAHALGDRGLDPLDGLDEPALGEAELLGADLGRLLVLLRRGRGGLLCGSHRAPLQLEGARL